MDGAKKKLLPLPPKWVKVNSDRGPYYWNKEANSTQWKFPREEALEFLSLQKDHGYINLPNKEGETEATHPKRGSVKRTSRRRPRPMETSNSIDTPPLVPKKDPSITKQSIETSNSNHASSTNGKPPKATPPEAVDTPPEIDTPPPPLPPRQFIKNSDRVIDSQTPPPLPARNYCEEDLVELQNKNMPIIEVESSLFQDDDDSSPPPIPAQTELSTQLVTPPTLQEQNQHFIYSSNLSDLSVMGGRRGDKSVEPMSPSTPIPQGEGHPDTIEGSDPPLLYDVIVEPRSRISGVVGVASGVVGVASEDRYSTLNNRISNVETVREPVVGVVNENSYSTLNNGAINTTRDEVGVVTMRSDVANESSYSTLNNGAINTTRDEVGVVTMRSDVANENSYSTLNNGPINTTRDEVGVVSLQSQELLLYDEIPNDTARGVATTRGVATLRSSVQSNVGNDSDANLLYDEVYDPKTRPLSNTANTKPSSSEESCYNRLNYTPGAGNKPTVVDSIVGSDQPLLYDEVCDSSNRTSVAARISVAQGNKPPAVDSDQPLLYDEVSDSSNRTSVAARVSVVVSKPPPSHADHNDALYDEVHVEGRAQSLDRNSAPSINKPLEGSFYEELDRVSKPTITTPESRRRVVTADTSARTTKPFEPPLPEPRVTPSSQRRALGRMGGSFPAPLQSPPPPPSQGSDGPPSPGDRPPALIPSSETKKRGSKRKSKPSRHSTKETTPTPPTNQYQDLPVQAYEVVPLNLHPSKPPSSPVDTNSDDLFMTVNHEKQRQRFERFGGSLRNPDTPPVPSRKKETEVSRTKSAFLHSSNPSLDKNDAYDRLNHIQATVSTTAVTLPRNLSQTPSSTRESTYSTLKLTSEEKARMRAGVQVHGSKMTNSASDLADRNSSQGSSEEGFMSLIHAPNASGASIKKRHHFYEDFGEGDESARLIARRHSNPVIGDYRTELVFAPNEPTSHTITRKPHLYEDCERDDDHKEWGKSIKRGRSIDEVSTNEKVPLIFAPNVPSPTVKHKPHLYEELEKEAGKLGDMPTLAWDDDLVPKQDGSSGFTGAEDSSKISKPSSVADKDYQKRLQRLDHHYYPELDIPIWPDQEPVLVSPSPKLQTDIQKVVRDSWLPPKESDQDLPDGWTKEINEQGQEFYWHIPTGKIQYVKPLAGVPPRLSKSRSPGDTDSVSSPTVQSTFAAEYWGSCAVSEDMLVKGKSVQVVLSCIKQLLVDKDIESENFQLCGGLQRGSNVHIRITGSELHWLSSDSNTVLVNQTIARIRVWGVGQENEREFGYIARNLSTNRHVCHVFVCDIAAMGIAQAMLNSHSMSTSKARQSRRPSLTSDLSASDIGNNESGRGTVLVQVPMSAAQRERSVSKAQDNPMKEEEDKSSKDPQEKYKRLEAVYIGFTDVVGSHGINVLNDAVSQLSIAKSRWLPVYVDIATSHIKILDKKTEQVLKEHRVRFLSFLGIANDDRYCGYVVDNGDNQFLFHGFQCQPNADKLCLALHSACQARYQRVIDAHLNEGEIGNIDSSTMKRKKSLLSRIGSWKSKSKDQDDESSKPTTQSFIVQFMGFEQIPKPQGVDSIKEPLRKFCRKTSGIHLVELLVSPSGFTINDPQKKNFASKHFLSKKICYCAHVRSNFVFIAKEGSNKYFCYIFAESEVDIASIKAAINELMG